MESMIALLRAVLPWLVIALLYAVLLVIRAREKRERAVDCDAEGMSLGICPGLCAEVLLGSHSGIGIAIGMLIGLAIGTCIRGENCGGADDRT